MTTLTWDWTPGRRVALYNAVVELEARMGSAVQSGTGSPEGVVTAPVDTLWLDTTGALGVWLWVKATGTGNTGWQPTSPAVGWDDLRVSLAMSTKSNQGPPTLTTFKTPTMAFAFAKGDQVYFDVQLPHAWVLESTIEPHIHWAPSSTGKGTVQWQLSYTWANFDDAYPSATTLDAVSQAGSGTAFDHMIADLGTIDGTGMKASSVMMCHLTRVNAGTFADTVFGLSVDFHIQVFGNGGSSEYGGAT